MVRQIETRMETEIKGKGQEIGSWRRVETRRNLGEKLEKIDLNGVGLGFFFKTVSFARTLPKVVTLFW